VLVVEDNPVNREVARAMLQALQVEIHTADSGLEALKRLESETFDAILMDCQMPDLDGYETTERYRVLEAATGRARTPIIALTANAQAGDAERCLAAGMDHYLSKPFTLDELGSALDLCAPAAAAAPRASVASDVLDAATLERIRELSARGSPDLLERLIASYESNSRELLGKLHAALEGADTDALARAAHALKSSSGNVGALSLSALCLEVEQAAGQSDLPAAHAFLGQLAAEHERVLRALHECVGGPGVRETAHTPASEPEAYDPEALYAVLFGNDAGEIPVTKARAS
jgi:CheY-like chemotaxis protein